MSGRNDDKVVYAAASTRCNNSCVFCTDLSGTRRESRARVSARDLRAPASGRRIVFTSSEPTLNKDLFALVASAKKRGYTGIAVTTNGRMLAYPDYCAKLLKSGVSEVIVSLHGATAAVHDAITGVPGSWEQTTAGLKNLLKFRRLAPDVYISVNCTINALNLRELGALKRFLLGLRGLKHAVFHGLRPAGRAQRRWRRLAVRYSGAVKALAAGGWPGRLRVWDIPLCALDGRAPRRACEFARAGTAYVARAGEGVEALTGKIVLPCCAGCAALPRCGGVYRRYADLFGTKEFHALEA